MEKQNHLNACGTFEEVNYAVAKTITELEKTNQELPYLLNYYKKNYNSPKYYWNYDKWLHC